MRVSCLSRSIQLCGFLFFLDPLNVIGLLMGFGSLRGLGVLFVYDTLEAIGLLVGHGSLWRDGVLIVFDTLVLRGFLIGDRYTNQAMGFCFHKVA